MMAARRSGGGGDAMAACGPLRCGDDGEVSMGGARSGGGRRGGGMEACGGGGGDSGWTPSPAFREKPLWRRLLSFSNDG